jgi:CheY-like chemotaxis protein
MYKAKVSDPDQWYRDSYRKLNILIVDDDETSRNSLKDMIKMHGHNVTTLDEGMKCVNRCSNHTYDLIFMDYHMDNMGDEAGEIDGAEVTKMVRECFDIDCPIYAYTGDSTEQAIKQFKLNDMKGAFIKPVEPSLIAEFFKIVEKKTVDQVQLSKLALKRKNFMYFKQRAINSSNTTSSSSNQSSAKLN